MTIETIEHAGCTIHLHHDEITENPRHYDDLFTVFCAHHKNYILGDEQGDIDDLAYKLLSYNTLHYLEAKAKRNDFNLDALFLEEIEEQYIISPVYMYEHSGIALRLSPFSCGWDSGQIGFIYCSKKDARKALGVQRITKRVLAKLTLMQAAVIEEYSAWLNGECYFYEVLDASGEQIDSCGGFLGDKGYALAIEIAENSAEGFAKSEAV